MTALTVLWSNLVYAQDATQTAATSAFNSLATWMINVATGPFSKIIALGFLIAAGFALIKQSWGLFAAIVIALLILIFTPQILSVFQNAS